MKITELLIGRKARVKTDVGVVVELEIHSIKENQHRREITPDTKENDWYGESVYWTDYKVIFTSGGVRIYKKLEDIDLV